MLSPEIGDLVLGVLYLLDHVLFFIIFAVSLVFLNMGSDMGSVPFDFLFGRCGVVGHDGCLSTRDYAEMGGREGQLLAWQWGGRYL